MAQLKIPKTYADASNPTASQIETFQKGVEKFVNITKLNSDNIQAGGIATANIAANAVTRAKLVSVGQQVSSSSGTYIITSSLADVTNLSVSITTTGRPVMVEIISDGSGLNAALSLDNMTSTSANTDIALLRDSTIISYHRTGMDRTTGGNCSLFIPASSFWALDTPSSGTYTYKVQAIKSGTTVANIANCKLAVYEL